MATPDVALVSPYPAAGQRHGGFSGVASYAAALAHALAGAGARVEVIAPTEAGEPARSHDGPVVVRRCFARGPRALPVALRAARATGARTVHLQHETFLYGGPAAVLGLAPALASLRRSPTRLVVTMHHVVANRTVDRDFTRMHRVAVPAAVARLALAAVRRAISAFAHRVIVLEPAFAQTVRGAAFVPHGIEQPRAAPALAREQAQDRLDLDPDRLTVLCFGFVAPYKGLERALEAATEAGVAVQLVVAGAEHPRLLAAGDDYATALRERHPLVRFTGHVPDADVGDWFTAADLALFLHPQPVGTSGGLAVALAHGTAVMLSAELATTVGALPALKAPRDASSLAQRLRALAAQRGGLDALRAGAAELGRGRAWPLVARRHLDIYAGAG